MKALHSFLIKHSKSSNGKVQYIQTSDFQSAPPATAMTKKYDFMETFCQP